MLLLNVFGLKSKENTCIERLHKLECYDPSAIIYKYTCVYHNHFSEGIRKEQCNIRVVRLAYPGQQWASASHRLAIPFTEMANTYHISALQRALMAFGLSKTSFSYVDAVGYLSPELFKFLPYLVLLVGPILALYSCMSLIP